MTRLIQITEKRRAERLVISTASSDGEQTKVGTSSTTSRRRNRCSALLARQCRHSELDSSESLEVLEGRCGLFSRRPPRVTGVGRSVRRFFDVEESAAFLYERLRPFCVSGFDADLSYAGGSEVRRRRGIETLYDQRC